MDHLQAQLIPRALAAAEIAVRLDPDSGKARANRGNASLAGEFFREALRLTESYNGADIRRRLEVAVLDARLGQRGRVRRWYDICVRTLRIELDAVPEPETESLYRLALTGKA